MCFRGGEKTVGGSSTPSPPAIQTLSDINVYIYMQHGVDPINQRMSVVLLQVNFKSPSTPRSGPTDQKILCCCPKFSVL